VVNGGAFGVGRGGKLLGDNSQTITLNSALYISVNKTILSSVFTKIDNGKMYPYMNVSIICERKFITFVIATCPEFDFHLALSKNDYCLTCRLSQLQHRRKMEDIS
jgi:hypothetical protein